MTVLQWDKTSEKTYQTGVDRGVLYLPDGSGVVWNGITSVEDTANSELKSYYMDGIKFLDTVIPGDFQGKLQAFTYPEEFDALNGIDVDSDSMMAYYNQPVKSFNLSYRTKIGNDVEGLDLGYKLHLLFNLVANPDNVVSESLTDQPTPIEFGWTLSGTPVKFPGKKPTAHVSVDSRTIIPANLIKLENALYGTDTTDPHFPSMAELADILTLGSLVITDNGDGTWTATEAADFDVDYISMIDADTFQIDNADVTYLDADTYEISTTDHS